MTTWNTSLSVLTEEILRISNCQTPSGGSEDQLMALFLTLTSLLLPNSSDTSFNKSLSASLYRKIKPSIHSMSDFMSGRHPYLSFYTSWSRKLTWLLCCRCKSHTCQGSLCSCVTLFYMIYDDFTVLSFSHDPSGTNRCMFLWEPGH